MENDKNNTKNSPKMNFKKALNLTDSAETDMMDMNGGTDYTQSVIKYTPWEGKPGWLKITQATEIVANKKMGFRVLPEKEETISLEPFVKLQERRMEEYDSTRWEGAFRELYPIYPPYPEEDPDDNDEDIDGQYNSDSDYYYSDQGY